MHATAITNERTIPIIPVSKDGFAWKEQMSIGCKEEYSNRYNPSDMSDDIAAAVTINNDNIRTLPCSLHQWSISFPGRGLKT